MFILVNSSVDNRIVIDDIDESDFLIRAQLDKEFICKLSGLVQAGLLAVLVTFLLLLLTRN